MKAKRFFWYALLMALTFTIAIPAYYLWRLSYSHGWYKTARAIENGKNRFRDRFVNPILDRLEFYDSQKAL